MVDGFQQYTIIAEATECAYPPPTPLLRLLQSSD
jgi:hypothetical protein